MKIPLPDHGLHQFLKTALQVHHRFISGGLSRAESPIYVIGNPSADLDSIISALVYSYFANNRALRDYQRPHVPIINLDNVLAGSELRRLRPEFVKALQLATENARNTSEAEESSMLKEHFLTVADFAAQLQQRPSRRPIQAESVLVDWNALPIRSSDTRRGTGSLPGLSAVEFTVVGCIDHHANEKFLSSISEAQPLVVEPAGSCTSLVVRTLEELSLWQKANTGGSKSVSASEKQIAKLAMAPILIDTANLTSKDKVTKFDISAYDFLLPKATTGDSSWDSSRFYTAIHETKQNSLELLTVDEVLDRDYKEWAEKPSRTVDQAPVQIGICSMVKSIPWVVRKAGGSAAFLDSLKQFALHRKLDIVLVMTAFSSAKEGQFSRELLAYTLNDRGVNALKSFISQASSQLGLGEWFPLDGDDHAQDIKSRLQSSEDGALWTRLWVQTNVAKSRKQLAPLVRDAAASL
ncbi:putative exopolyphosphatase [Aspergillus lucknowensis]|uniref:DHHA2 domain-containing protein n=1 Tax=Aspergillus lucknowensis TaxID=176173 RepID=A0ABR4LHX0_9EURO